MSVRSRRIDIDSGELRTVSVDSVTKELSRLWGDISNQVEERTGQIPLRTSILTLVIVAQGPAEARTARATLEQLVEQMPSRAIVIELGPSGTQIEAHVTAHCRALDGGQAACYEVIELKAPSDRIGALPSLLVPLELFDVPSFMWWVGSVDFDSFLFHKLAASAERIIIDTSRTDSALAALSGYHQFLNNPDCVCTGTDLNWARATSWRELITQSFDHPQTIGLVSDIQRVEAAYDPDAEAQALLITGWIASRLGWTLGKAQRSSSGYVLSFSTPDGDETTVNLNPQASVGVGLRSVRILAGTRRNAVRISVRRRGTDLAAVLIETAGTARQERVVRDVAPRLCDLIGKELLLHTRDPVFDQSIDVVADIVACLRENHDQG
jgi:glucose-6-phosphate dehydrogenase assembly protein OpcA